MDKKLQHTFDDGSKIWFTSDTHFGHKNIIKYCHRPFLTTNEMDETIIKNWNSVVKENDIVFHLGDFAFGSNNYIKQIIELLNGKICLIIGNHDENYIYKDNFNELFDWVGYQAHIFIENKSIYLNHYPFQCFAGAWKGIDASWQLFGHVHSGPKTINGLDVNRLNNMFPTQYDVGVDNNNFFPVSFNKVKEIITDQQMSLNLIR